MEEYYRKLGAAYKKAHDARQLDREATARRADKIKVEKEILEYILLENSMGKRLKDYSLLTKFPYSKPMLRQMVRQGLLDSSRDYESSGPGQREGFRWYEITPKALEQTSCKSDSR